MTGEEIVAEARAWVGVRYAHQGRSREGVDCIGLPVCVRAALGLPELDVAGYERTATDSAMLDFCRKHMVQVAADALQPGDVLVCVNGTMRHMAIVADYLYGGHSIIHAWLPARAVVECRLDDKFMAGVTGCFRFSEVTA
jgi:cell wall-associated NlpC family hydrolase